MKRKDRIELNDTTIDILMKMSESNPGAITVCMRMLNEGAEIDPQSFEGGLSAILMMDSHGIYGNRIWMLYKDVCGEDLESTIAVLRACQLGQLRESDMLHAIDNRGQGIDVAALVAGVKERLDQFGAKAA